MLISEYDVVRLVGEVQYRSENVCTDSQCEVAKVVCAKWDTKEDDDVESEEGVTS